MSVILLIIEVAIRNNAMKVTVAAIIRVSFFPSGGSSIFSMPVHMIYRPKAESRFTKINDSSSWLTIWHSIKRYCRTDNYPEPNAEITSDPDKRGDLI